MELVQSMRNENSGVPSKLRTYGGMATSGLPAKVARDGGATIDLASPTLRDAAKTTGYFVGGATTCITFDAGSDVRQYQYALGYVYARMNGTGYFGVWESEGLVYAEGSDWFASVDEALSAARIRGQIAIWDVSRSAEILA